MIFIASRHARNYFAAAVLLLLLGLSNIAFGNHKLAEYSQILSEAQDSFTSPENELDRFIPQPLLDSNEEEEAQKKLLARKDYYHLVVIGGKTFIALSAILLLATLSALLLEEGKGRR